MATLFFGIAGNAIAPGAGGIIGGIVGAAIDTAVGITVSRALRPPPPKPERDRNLTADSGNMAADVYGRYVRVTGQVIWMGTVREIEISGEQKGKGDTAVTYKYVCTLAIAFARSVIADFTAVYANGDAVFSQLGTSGSVISVPVEFIVAHTFTKGTETIQVVTFFFTLAIAETVYPVAQAGLPHIISGPVAANAGRYAVLGPEWIWPPNPDPSLYACLSFVRCHTSDPLCTGGVSVPAPAGTWTFQVDNTFSYDPQYINEDPEKHYGLIAQDVSPVLDAYFVDTVGNSDFLPAYRSTAYVVLKDFNVSRFGGSLPRFEAVLEVQNIAPTVGDVLSRLASRSTTNIGVSVDVDGVQDILLQGFSVLGPQQLINPIRQLMEFYFLDALETFEVDEFSGIVRPYIKFVKRRDVGAVDVSYVDTGAQEEGTDGSYNRQEVVIVDRRNLPSSMVLDFIDSANAFQVGSLAYSLRIGNVVSDTTTKLSTDLVFNPAQAQALARAMLWTANSNHDQIKITLPFTYLHVQPGDRINWPLPGNDPDDVRFRVNKVSRGQNGVIELEGIVDNQSAYQQTYPVVYSSPPPLPNPHASGFSMIYVLDMPPLQEDEAGQFGLYIFNAIDVSQPLSVNVGFPTTGTSANVTIIYKSIDNGDNFLKFASQSSVGLYGFATTVLGNASDIAWDTFNSVEIQLAEPYMSLSDAGEEIVAAGLRNNAILGNEVIGFLRAIPLGTGKYRLLGLIRGRRDTIAAAGTHNVQDLFILLDPTKPLLFGRLPNPDFNRELVFTGVPAGASPQDAMMYSIDYITPQAETLKPFKPRSRWLIRFDDLCVRLHFKWRTRVPYRIGCGVPPPRIDVSHCFAVDIFWMDAGDEFIRTIECCFEHDDEYYFEYSRSAQAADFHNTFRILDGSYPIKLRFELYKVSSTVGSGRRSVGIMNSAGPTVLFF